MSKTIRARPLSPHLGIYRLIPTMLMSVLHRITGAALYFGTVLLAIWIVAAATSPSAFAAVSAVYGSWIGLLVLFGYTFVLMHHMMGGLRHLVWDTAFAMEKEMSTKMAWATLAASVTLTLLIWIVGFMMMGA